MGRPRGMEGREIRSAALVGASLSTTVGTSYDVHARPARICVPQTEIMNQLIRASPYPVFILVPKFGEGIARG